MPFFPSHLLREISLRTRVRRLLRRIAHSCEIYRYACVVADIPGILDACVGLGNPHDGSSFSNYSGRDVRTEVNRRKRVQRDKDDFLRERGTDVARSCVSVSLHAARGVYYKGFHQARCASFIFTNSGFLCACFNKGLARHASRPYRGDVFPGTDNAPSFSYLRNESLI